MCPYLRVGESWSNCAAYIGPCTEPSVYEREYYCNTCSHPSCVWFLSSMKEVIPNKEADCATTNHDVEWSEELMAHSRI
jgi:hypothetical protein